MKCEKCHKIYPDEFIYCPTCNVKTIRKYVARELQKNEGISDLIEIKKIK